MPGFFTPPGIRWSALSILYPHVQNSLTSLPRPLPLPDIGWDPIICTCSSPMSFHPFLSIQPCSLPHFTCLSSLPHRPRPSPPPHSNPPPPGYYVWPLSTLIPRIYSIYLFPLPLPTPPLRLSHPPPIEPAISWMATSTRKHARWHSTGSGPTSTCRSYCPSARQQQGDNIKSWIICDQTRIQSVAESLKIKKIS